MKSKIESVVPGIIYAVQYLVLLRDEPTFAEELMAESGHTMQEFLNEQKQTGYETRKINAVIRKAFTKNQRFSAQTK